MSHDDLQGVDLVKRKILTAFKALDPQSLEVSAEQIKASREYVRLTARQLFITASEAVPRLAELVREVVQEIRENRSQSPQRW